MYLSLQRLKIQVVLYFLFVTVASSLLSWFPEHYSPIASQVYFIISSGKKKICGRQTTGERSEGSTFLSRYNIKNNISVHIY